MAMFSVVSVLQLFCPWGEGPTMQGPNRFHPVQGPGPIVTPPPPPPPPYWALHPQTCSNLFRLDVTDPRHVQTCSVWTSLYSWRLASYWNAFLFAVNIDPGLQSK